MPRVVVVVIVVVEGGLLQHKAPRWHEGVI